MAVTSIWRVKGSVGKVVMYVENPDKTTETAEEEICINGAEDILTALAKYVERDSATNRKRYVTGLNCCPETAAEDMMDVKRQFGKTGGVVAYHGYQSFMEGEVSPEIAHEIGVKLAEELWGDYYQVVVTTHLDKQSHIHNHFCVNTVSFVDGIKYHRTKQDYADMQYVSDRLCEEYGLSVIRYPEKKGLNYGEWKAHKDGKPTVRDGIREAIDIAVNASVNPEQVKQILDQLGYVLNFSGQHPKIRSVNSEHYVRFRSLGPGYTWEDIEMMTLQNDFPKEPDFPEQEAPQQIFGGDTTPVGEMTLPKVYAVFIHAIEITMDRKETNIHLYNLMKEEHRQLERYKAESRVLAENGLKTDADLANFKMKTEDRLADLIGQRKGLRNALKRAERSGDAGEIHRIKYEISSLTRQISYCRDDLDACYRIGERSGIMREKLEQIHSEKFRASAVMGTPTNVIRKTKKGLENERTN